MEYNSSNVTVRFLKRDGDVGLFINDKGKKFNVNKANVFNVLDWLEPNGLALVKEVYMIPVNHSRRVVSNLKEAIESSTINTLFDDVDKDVWPNKTQYEGAKNVSIVSTKQDESFLGIPIGTKFHWVSFGEIPNLGDSFIVGKRTPKGSVVGSVSKVDRDKSTCVINGVTIKIWDLSFRIINPKHVFETRRKKIIENW